MTGYIMYLHVLIQWLNFGGIVLLVGGVVFRWAVLNQSLAVLDPAPPEQAALKAASYRDLKRLVGGCLILLSIVSFIDLILRAQMMSGKSFLQVPAILPLVLQTHTGKTWLAKMVILCFLGGRWFLMKESSRPGQQSLLLLTSAGLCLMVSLSGHAADQGNFSLSLLADWLHVMAISTWAGGLVPLRFLTPKLLTMLDGKNQFKLEVAVLQRFSWLAVRCVSVLILAGTYMSWLRLRTLPNLVTTPYGITLLFKLAFVAPMLGLGALSRYCILPALQMLMRISARESFIGRMVNRVAYLFWGRTGHEDFHTFQRRFQICVALECLLAVVVLGLTALLTQTSPPDLTGFGAPGGPSDMGNMGM